MTEWEPATETEAAMRDALRANDQELYFRILARTELLLPVSAQALAGRVPMGWGTWTTGGRTHVLAFTSVPAVQACLAENAGSTRRTTYRELAAAWPNHEWWLAVNPGLPIEGYLPAWFVAQLARGDVRLPGRTIGARARLEQVESAARARATAVVPGQLPPAGERSPVPPQVGEPAAPAPVAAPYAPPPVPVGVPPAALPGEPVSAALVGPTSEHALAAWVTAAASPPTADDPSGGTGHRLAGVRQASTPTTAGRAAEAFAAGRAARAGTSGRTSAGPGGFPSFGPSPSSRPAAAPTGDGGSAVPDRGSAAGAVQSVTGGNDWSAFGSQSPAGNGRSGGPLPAREPGDSLIGRREGVPDGPPGPSRWEPGPAATTGPESGYVTTGSLAGYVIGPGMDHDREIALGYDRDLRRPDPDGPGGGERQDGERPVPPGARPAPELLERAASTEPMGAAAAPVVPAPAAPPPVVPAPPSFTPAPPAPAPASDPAPATAPASVSAPAGFAPISPEPPPPFVRQEEEAPAGIRVEPPPPFVPPQPPLTAPTAPAPTAPAPTAPAPTAPTSPAVGLAAPTSLAAPSPSPSPASPPSSAATTFPAAPVTAASPPAETAPVSATGSPVAAPPPPFVPGAPAGANTRPAVATAPLADAPPPGDPVVPNPVAAGFRPANDVERSLLAATGEGRTDNFLSTLLLAKVLLPVSYLSSTGARPGEDGFAWRTERIDGATYVVVFTSPERLVDHLGESVETVSVKFAQLIQQWPQNDWSFAVNPGTPVGARFPGSQIVALANWASEVGLGTEADAGSPDSGESTPAAEAAPAAPRPAYAPTREDPTQPTMMQKTVAPAQVGYYLDRGYDRVSGFVHRAGEIAHLDTPAKLYATLGLGYPGSPFTRDASEIYVLRWPAHRPSLYRIPYGGQNEIAMRAMEGWVIERPPFRGNGFAPGENSDVVAEFKVDSIRLPHGSQLVQLAADGTEKLVAILDVDARAWHRVGEE